MIGLLSALALMLLVSPSEANFVQCPGGPCGAVQGTTEEADVINGTPDVDGLIIALGGNDLIFGNAGSDEIIGGSGDDFIIGGLNSDTTRGGRGQ